MDMNLVPCKCRSKLLETVAQNARKADVFAEVRVEPDRLVCVALGSAEHAEYRLSWDDEKQIWVSLVTKDRWLSESIEAVLMATGDAIEELLEDELVDQGYEGEPLPVSHFRSDDMYFTFQSPIPNANCSNPDAALVVTQCLLAYEACFGQLGDMAPSGED